MELDSIVWILVILVVINIIFTYYVYCRQEIVNIEGFAVDKEALQSLASVLNKGTMSITNLNVTGELNVPGKVVGNLKVNDLEVSGKTKTKDLNLDGIHIAKHPTRKYLKIPYPVEINDAIDSKVNEPYPGIIVGNVISTTAPGNNAGLAINYGVNVLKQMPYLPNGSKISELGVKYVLNGYGGSQNWSVKKMVTPGYGDYHGYYTQGKFYPSGGWRK